jgi:hypothetical protein
MYWDYLFVEFTAINNVYHVYKVNDVPFKGVGPETLRSAFCKKLGLEGWEMVNHSYEVGDRGPARALTVFKKLLPHESSPGRPWPPSQQ